MNIEQIGTIFPRFRIIHDGMVWAGDHWVAPHLPGMLYANREIAEQESKSLDQEGVDRTVIVPVRITVYVSGELNIDRVRESLSQRVTLETTKLLYDPAIASLNFEWDQLKEAP